MSRGGGFVRSVGALSAARMAIVLSQVLALPIIARHLSPDEFALVALAMSIVVFANGLSDAGLGRSLIRARTYVEAEWASVFWLLAGFGVALAALLIAAAPLWAWFFGRPELVPLVSVLAAMPLLSALAAVPVAEMERSGRFAVLAWLSVSSAVLGLCAAVALAVAGWGAWALVAQQVVLAGMQFTGASVFTGFRPRAAFSPALLRGHFSFSRDTIGVAMVLIAQKQAAVVAIGRLVGAQSLGIYAMSERFVNLPKRGLTFPFLRVVYLSMARSRTDPARMGELYLASLRMLSAAVMPPMALLAAAGEAVFTQFLSEDWAGVGLVFALVAPGVALEASSAGAGNLFMASGRTALRLRMAIEKTLLWIAILAVAAPFGLFAAAAARSVWLTLYMPRYWSLAARCAPFDLVACCRAVAPAASVAVVFWLSHELLVAATDPGRGAEIALAAGETLVAYAVLLAFRHRRLRADLRTLQYGTGGTGAGGPRCGGSEQGGT